MKKFLASVFAIALFAAPALAGVVPPTPAQILVGGKAGSTIPYGFQRDLGFVSPFSPPYNVVSGTGVSAAQRTANRTGLNQWFQDTAVTYPGALSAINDVIIEVGVSPGNSVDFRNSNSAAGNYIVGVPGGTTVKCFNDFNNAWVVQAPCVLGGGRWQHITGLKIQAGVVATTDPVVNTLTASITGTTMTVTVASTTNLAVGQAIVGAAATPVPAGCYISALGTGTGGTGTYTVSAACGTISSQTMYGGAAGELIEDGVHGGSTALDLYCPSNGKYANIYGTGFQRGMAFPQVNASAYGSCGSGNNAFSTTFDTLRFDAHYRPIDFRGWNAGSSGDTWNNIYTVGYSSNDVNFCAVFNKYVVSATQWNCESMKFGGVASADVLDPAETGGGQQSNLSTVGDVFINGSSRILLPDFHYENNTRICASPGTDNAGMFYTGSGSTLKIGNIDFSSNNISSTNSCTLYNFWRGFGSGAKQVSIDRVFDGGTTGSIANTLTGVVMHLATSNGSSLGKSSFEFGRAQANAGNLSFSMDVNNLPTSDVPVLKSIADSASYFAGSGTTTATVKGVKGTITVTGLTTLAGQTSAAMVVTDTNNVNASTLGLSCKIQNYTGTGAPFVTNAKFSADTFQFTISNLDAINALNANVVVWCEIDNGKS